MNGLAQKVAFVTGGGSGIGRQVSLRLAREGARVGVVDLREEAAQAVAEEITAAGGEALVVVADVTSAAQVEAGVAQLNDAFGGVHFVVNCAGVAFGEGGVVECSEAAWDKTMAINVKSIFLTGKYAIPQIIASGGGSIVNIASVFGMVANPDECGYAASKGAVINLTRQMAVQHAQDRVRVNAVLPSDCDTPLIAGLLGVEGAELEAAKAELAAPIPMGRLAQPEEIASGIAFLLSDDAGFITGVSLPIDGGFLTK
ncbi:SDR family NAD(P)-dependent oxidoreductase [Leucobacter luti]|uniref:NAD(P)-dependent dehydrogenase (Short-subunit alcohol dehydrogenase family) n=1 Tax=Leucobacter luti TaxID=340320 RepID=A0A4R6RX73_9MICO|nr:glucose 1-dehydrogenase [Leucobacter luti]MCW2289612.1 NAD(P)-dependent dehydrogenase (short-subunit alcohol dehydrogenase family) [Leucobacter luti]QYM77209.1 glucose 1-dehydrogenase [Leucobacter luti]TCK37784.1 NAD(P)-dependent dehydrogenase (short-subunit alcohol dehydrogenase family) [Leucobacter luti]TDP90776.1 NAD(P)-dependent dehydrogenase (short-subunit alcohol dehydrogenase family) [Leucobacter luti]